jgi:hypothetical protein
MDWLLLLEGDATLLLLLLEGDAAAAAAATRPLNDTWAKIKNKKQADKPDDFAIKYNLNTRFGFKIIHPECPQVLRSKASPTVYLRLCVYLQVMGQAASFT